MTEVKVSGKGSNNDTPSEVVPGVEDVTVSSHLSHSGTDKAIVAAIDFGTTYSGYAYTFRNEYEKSAGAREIFINRWTRNSGANMSAKAPTTALFDTAMNFHSFGYEAEEKYAELIQQKQHQDWHCFRRFKMKLHDRMTLKRKLKIADESGRKFSAKKVYTESIRYLRKKVLTSIKATNQKKDKDAIHWVLTIPAIWTEPAKQFMREVAIEAGIPTSDLRIALEPEAAAVYCRSLPAGTLVGSRDRGVTDAFQPGGCYMIVDMGGGTVDTTVHEVAEDGRLMEVRQASGGPWGGTSVDDTFYEFIVGKFGKEFIDKFRIERAADWIMLTTEFEAQKRKLSCDKSSKISIQIPSRLIAESKLKENQLSDGKIVIDNDALENFFRPSTEDIVTHIRSVLSEVSKIDLILLVGGFATSNYVIQIITNAFPEKRVLVPLQAEVAVLFGAVLFGFEPLTICARVCRHTYGIDSFERFREGDHRLDYKVMVDDLPHCDNIFNIIVANGERLSSSETRAHAYSSTHRGDHRRHTTMVVPVFASTDPTPRYTTEDSCVELGCIRVEPPTDGWPPEVHYCIEMFFGHTEFDLLVKDDVTGQIYQSHFDFLK
ncbi:heat shock 70 kDa protein 12A-like isoform X2 [Mizuhopecten yessoensis]|uniref:Heat shock 70 kDa protein n=2 Tax=Mizuhopecten yessoensis TaxID=6573 RepID=A0A1C9U329_MIZYE|nr:heat shock 70 kDa protein 12A-like isoform X2 [Mizuhopecten yessoensis]XP_021342850.1 heat shock 70 kDa protein 12A-like isoform X2 [Mizuhopecten yessoensis]XP_021342851.1 heat shock 70 kDa protein 12A-like isoform X2 [Mizuhopecten yessoensis]AOR17391.1 heat shock 70 kDa protein [Mizuhopecten yessoensis]OWF35257.1 Heat shock 70 kDa protein 12A [Mizuhopecten yessoensis]